MRALPSLLAAAVVAVLTGCGDDAPPADVDGAVPIDASPFDAAPDANPNMPLTLAETGLYKDPAHETLADNVHAFTPRWPLWSDGATKRRWIALPANTTIDTSDMNYWKFPVGTKLWKEFTVRDGGPRIETRLFQKIGAEDDQWYSVAFVWNEAQTEAIATPGGVSNALGTEHDVPSGTDCRKCHGRTPGRILGFSALQLDAPAVGNLDLDLAGAIGLGWLSNPPTAPTEGTAYFPLPEDPAGTRTAALGYLHGNCGGCHNPTSDVHDTIPMELKLDVAHLASWTETPTYVTAVDQLPERTLPNVTALIRSAAPNESAVVVRMESREAAIQMPPLATERADTDALTAVRAWIVNDLASP